MILGISVTLLTKNNEDTLEATLRSLASFPEILLYDTGSTDKTLEIARTFPNVHVQQGLFSGFGPTHNLVSSLAKHDWILSIDSDEELSPELVAEIHALPLNPTHVYALRRHNYFNGKHIRWCAGWHPDIVVRLYHRKKTRFTDAAVHERVITQGLLTVTLSSPLYHTPYRNMSAFLQKMQTYSTLFAEQSTTSSSLFKALVHSWFAFFKSYILKRGFLGGKEGFIISAYNGHTAFYKYLKLAEKTGALHKPFFNKSESEFRRAPFSDAPK